MVKRPLPLTVDPAKLASLQAEVGGVIRLADLPQLAEYAASPSDEVVVDLRFSYSGRGMLMLNGYLETTVRLTCQRCLEFVLLPLQLDIQLVLVNPDKLGEQDDLPEGYDSYLIQDQRLSLSDLVEEEILLALPIVPRHEECRVYPTEEQGARETGEETAPVDKEENPFQVLQGLRDELKRD